MVHEINRLSGLGISQRQIAKALDISRNTVKKYLADANNASLAIVRAPYSAPWASHVDWEFVKKECERGVALAHFWEEDLKQDAGQPRITYISFWREFKRRHPNIPIDFHKDHPPGERCEVDFKGSTPQLGYIDPDTKEYIPCRLFGSVLSFSQLLFIRVTPDETQSSFFDGVGRSYSYFGGVPLTTAVDNAKAQVTKAHRYDADINPEFFKFANHYQTAPLAMRPKKPKDKHLIENALGVFWRWAGPKIAKRKFSSIDEINAFILRLLVFFNNRTMKKYGCSRWEKFLNHEKDKLLELPSDPYMTGSWKNAKVHPDSHIQVLHNFYSVPFQNIGLTIDVRITATYIEIFKDLERIAIHQIYSPRTRGRYSTTKKHLPPSHQAMRNQTPQYLIEQAEKIGLGTLHVIQGLIGSEDHHPFTYLRRSMGIIRLAKRYSPLRLEEACLEILRLNYEMPKIRDIEGIINFRRSHKTEQSITRRPNANLRGQDSWGDFLN